MRSKCLQNKGKFRNLSGQKWCLQHHPALEHSQPSKEVGTVSHWEYYRDSSPKIKIEQFVTVRGSV